MVPGPHFAHVWHSLPVSKDEQRRMHYASESLIRVPRFKIAGK